METTFSPLFTGLIEHTVPKGQVLLMPDEEPKGVYYIRSGYVKGYEINSEGGNQLISIYGPGDIFPIFWSFGESDVKLFYESMCNVSFSIKAKEDFIAESKRNKQTLQGIVHYLLKNYRFTHGRIQNYEYFNVPERVAYRLLFLAEHFGRRRGQMVVIEVPCRYQDIADAINSSRDTVSRAISDLISAKIISRKHTKITILDPSRLTEVIEKSKS